MSTSLAEALSPDQQTLTLRSGREVLPPEIGQFTTLDLLDLRHNRIRQVPPEIGRLANLRDLFLSHNMLTSLPPEIGRLVNLRDLLLDHNQLATLPPEIGQLPNLWRLDLRANLLEALPPTVGDLRGLWRLNLSQNRLQTLPAEIGDLASLLALDLTNNPLTSLPATLANLSLLDDLVLDGCVALTSLPAGLRVRRLSLRQCEGLTSLPPDLVVSEWVDIGGSRVVGKAPAGAEVRWNGVTMPQRSRVMHPEKLTTAHILKEQNLEVRRALIERIGLERFVRDARPTVLQSDSDPGGERRLLRIELQHDEPLVLLHVTDPSTGRQYFLRVPPNMSTCHQAAAWIAGFDDPADYRPIIET